MNGRDFPITSLGNGVVCRTAANQNPGQRNLIISGNVVGRQRFRQLVGNQFSINVISVFNMEGFTFDYLICATITFDV